MLEDWKRGTLAGGIVADRAGETATSRNGTHWTLQQFTTIAGHPWFALQQHNDAGIISQFTGYRHEVDAMCSKHGITPEELDPITEQEFFDRQKSPDEPEDDDFLAHFQNRPEP